MPWLLSATGVLAMVLAGRKIALGWAVAMASEALWFVYAVRTEQWGFIPGGIAYAIAFAWNYKTWRKQ